MPHAPPTILFHSITPDNTRLEAHIMKFLNVYSPSVRYYLIPISPKYTPHHPILEDTKPTYFPQCEGPNFTHKNHLLRMKIQKTKQTYSSSTRKHNEHDSNSQHIKRQICQVDISVPATNQTSRSPMSHSTLCYQHELSFT